jgi:hypothetical protein
MIRSYGCSWSWGQPWTPDSSDLARGRSGAWTGQSCRSIGSVRSANRRWARRSRPGPPGLRRVIRASRVVPPAGSTPSPCGGGWVGFTTVPLGCVGGRPRRGHRPVSTRPSCRVPRNWLWSRPSTPAPLLNDHGRTTPVSGPAQLHDQLERGTNCRGVFPVRTHQLPGCSPSPDSADHTQIQGRPGGDAGTTARCVAPKPRWSRPGRACPRVGDGRPSNPGGR